MSLFNVQDKTCLWLYYYKMETYIGTATTLDPKKFDEGWVDIGIVITLQDAIKYLENI